MTTDNEVVDLENVEIIEEETEGNNTPPLITDPGWNDYVLSLFVDDEMWKGNPTVDGLRRVVELVLGEVIESETLLAQTPDANNEFRASATVKVSIDTGAGIVKSFSGSADAYDGNLDGDFKRHAVAMAETRAEGRALRRALRLRNIAAEEAMTGQSGSAANETIVKPITDNQLNMISMMCGNNSRGLNINVEKLVKVLAEQTKLSYNTIKGLTETDGAVLIKTLGEFQRSESPIPPEVIGYDANWRN